MGLPSGIRRLDEILGGLNEGLHILGGPPGVGKTSLAWQVSNEVARATPVVYATFENSPQNLTLKAICGLAEINSQDVRRGTADLKKLTAAATDWARNVAPRLAFLEGTAKLSIGQLRAAAMEVMSRHNVKRCLIVVDYMQLWAKMAAGYRKLDTAREPS